VFPSPEELVVGSAPGTDPLFPSAEEEGMGAAEPSDVDGGTNASASPIDPDVSETSNGFSGHEVSVTGKSSAAVMRVFAGRPASQDTRKSDAPSQAIHVTNILRMGESFAFDAPSIGFELANPFT
jgi:hypothetical protein